MDAARAAGRHDAHAEPALGVCQWFHFQAYDDVAAAIEAMHDLGLRRLRTGVSWADFHRPGGQAWYEWQFAALHEAGLELLVAVWHTPPSIAESGVCASAPKRLEDYADFVGQLARDHGECIEAIELWNEPNNLYKWDFRRVDPGWRKFGRMVALAGERAHEFGMPTVLGGMIPVDPHWLRLVDGLGALAHVDAVAIHGFPGMWSEHAPNWDWYAHWHGWGEKVASIVPDAGDRPVWVTETGLATWSLDREAIEGFHVDENEYHLGLVTHDGTRKPAYHRMKELVRERSEPVAIGTGAGGSFR